MKKTKIDGVTGVFFSDDEFEMIQNNIKKQRIEIENLSGVVNNG